MTWISQRHGKRIMVLNPPFPQISTILFYEQACYPPSPLGWWCQQDDLSGGVVAQGNMIPGPCGWGALCPIQCKALRESYCSKNLGWNNAFPPPVVREALFPECVARVPVSLWGFGGEAAFARSCSMLSTVRKRPQPFARVRNRLCEARKLSTEASASGVVPKACPVESWRGSYIGVWRGGVCVSDLRRRSYNGICRGGVCEGGLCRRSLNSLCRGGVCVIAFCRRNYIGVSSGSVCESDSCRRRYFGVCSRSDCLSDLRCRGWGILTCPKVVLMWVFCTAAMTLVFTRGCLCECFVLLSFVVVGFV